MLYGSEFKKRASLLAILLLLIAGSLLTACAEPLVPTATPIPFQPTPASEPLSMQPGGVTQPTPIPPDSANGQALFISATCNGCHYVDREDTLVGPGLLGIFARSGERKIGYSPEEYIEESIRQPSAFLVDGFQNLMPAFSAVQLSSSDVADLTAYLETLQ